MRSPQFDPSFFQGNRQALLESMAPGSMALVFAAERMVRNQDLYHPYRQDSDFFYLTGLQEPGGVLLLFEDLGGQTQEILFINPVDPVQEKWEGRMLTTQAAAEISGIKDVRTREHFLMDLFRMQRFTELCYLGLNDVFPDQPLTQAHLLAKDLQLRLPGLQFKKLHPLLVPLRNRKQGPEIQALTRSLEIIDQALKGVMAKLKPGMMEYQVEAELVYHYLDQGCDRLGYEVIAAGGQNACVLHYVANNCALKKGDLILIDTGGEYGMYSGDITRCYPVSGKFSKRQRQCYQAVLEVNKKFIKNLEPGKNWLQLSQEAGALIGEVYAEYGLIKDPKKHLEVSLHRIGHSLGLDIHDVSWSQVPLGPGSVITVEPGLYLPEEGIGIRIEDNVLITDDGVEVLSAMIPKEIDEIEEIMAKSKGKP